MFITGQIGNQVWQELVNTFSFLSLFFCQFIKTDNKTLLVIRTINLRGQHHQLSFVHPGKYNVEQ